MLVVISDLHFEEEAANHIVGDGRHEPIVFQRNLPAKPFRLLMQRLAYEAQRNGATHLDLVMAGDIFDINRTGLWFRKTANPADTRPYIAADTAAPDLEATLLAIIDGIAAEENVRDVLPVFREFAGGQYRDEEGALRPFPNQIPVRLHYIPGNHDRMARATPAVRRRVREYLGLPGDGSGFDTQLAFEPEKALVRHGHEYDYTNFAGDYRETAVIPTQIPHQQYLDAPVGDFVTIDVVSRLPTMFRETYGDDQILADPTLRELYKRLLEFDDLRPNSAIFNYFLHSNGQGIDPAAAWEHINGIVIELIEEIHDDPFLTGWLKRLDRKWYPDAIDAIQLALALKPWRWAGTIPLGLAESIAARALKSHGQRAGAETFAVREESIRNGRDRFIVAGHTHRPQVALLAHDAGGERYYTDTGTWRNRVPATPDFTQFGRLKALTYVTIYSDAEDRGAMAASDQKLVSFDFWSGVTQGWKKTEQGVQPIAAQTSSSSTA